ncbi:hypothetical protein [Bacillus paranthracis]|uniref:hypothetical protein n=1 Tax=Bacillus paranthracis TaxID=2026186 RepID=UPI000D6CAB39|nr:hypothetical protein [Bacillus paranthracis]PWN77147.1 hypothetical protein CV741_15670 [Bacillus cereus]PWN78400.1 hypothetical protein CV717_23330 [Bacillus cereus]QHH83321.1 hypothetical protein FPL02_05275 [Bacillus paranthracis]UHJ50057.1 hypothetical protein LU294_23700 [Bacillus paranthracis]
MKNSYKWVKAGRTYTYEDAIGNIYLIVENRMCNDSLNDAMLESVVTDYFDETVTYPELKTLEVKANYENGTPSSKC